MERSGSGVEVVGGGRESGPGVRVRDQTLTVRHPRVSGNESVSHPLERGPQMSVWAIAPVLPLRHGDLRDLNFRRQRGLCVVGLVEPLREQCPATRALGLRIDGTSRSGFAHESKYNYTPAWRKVFLPSRSKVRL